MSSTADKVNALWNVQMVQRRHLEKLYPYLDWSKMPFSSYNDFFRLKNIIDDCGAVWTNAYRRSNNEAADTRKYLYDYSGNGRDIELFNFAFAGGSGYNGFVENYYLSEKWGSLDSWSINTLNADKTEIHISELKNEGLYWLFLSNIGSDPVGSQYKFKIKITGLSDYINSGKNISINIGDSKTPLSTSADGVYEYTYTKTDETINIGVTLSCSAGNQGKCDITVKQLPDYPCALVSDGVDDYGQCIKDFALPDDYTVCAIRKYLTDNNNSGALVSKGSVAGRGAFYFEYNVEAGYSYGNVFYNAFPALFSYQAKSSYNGKVITAGTSSDTNDNKLNIFRDTENGLYKKAALSSFGIFTRTLTEDELRIVENCMMAEYIAMTGILDDVEYYDILDARFRSNDEDTDKRNKWTGRFGKLHMTLNNYAYSQMSGWNGSYINFTGYWTCDQRSSGLTDTKDGEYKVIFTNVDKIPAKGINYYQQVNTSSTIRVKARVSGLMLSEIFSLSYRNQEDTSWIKLTDGAGDCTLEADVPATQTFLFDIANISDKVDRKITLEIIPIYPGALVSDGVDDYAVSDEVIDEPIGGVAFLAHPIQKGSAGYIFGAQWKKYSIFSYLGIEDKIIIGDTGTNESSATIKELSRNTDDFYSMSRVPSVPGYEFVVALLQKDAHDEFGKNAIYQLRLIKSQPTDIQLEAIKWQMQKEHEDYLIQNGWMEIEPDEQ